jgi:hypothetical protein
MHLATAALTIVRPPRWMRIFHGLVAADTRDDVRCGVDFNTCQHPIWTHPAESGRAHRTERAISALFADGTCSLHPGDHAWLMSRASQRAIKLRRLCISPAVPLVRLLPKVLHTAQRLPHWAALAIGALPPPSRLPNAAASLPAAFAMLRSNLLIYAAEVGFNGSGRAGRDSTAPFLRASLPTTASHPLWWAHRPPREAILCSTDDQPRRALSSAHLSRLIPCSLLGDQACRPATAFVTLLLRGADAVKGGGGVAKPRYADDVCFSLASSLSLLDLHRASLQALPTSGLPHPSTCTANSQHRFPPTTGYATG